MVEEKRKRGRPKKIVESVLPRLPVMKESGTLPRTDQSYRRDDLCVQMIMGTIAKQGTIKYDHAKDIFDTATQLAYDFGWMERPKAKKQAVLDSVAEFVDSEIESVNTKQEAMANTPADILRQLREG